MGRYGSGRSALRVFGCGWVADGCFRRVIEAIHCLSVRARHEVPVGVYGELNGCVPELVTDMGERLLILDEQARVGMAEIVEADAPKLGSAFSPALCSRQD
jgi:hypothetical protein